MTTRIVDARFRGFGVDHFNGSVNGGYACGVVATALGADQVETTLLKPMPFGAPLRVEVAHESAEVWHDATKVAEGKVAPLALDVPAPPTLAEATVAAEHYVWHHDHPAAQCFVCGTAREDGLRIFTGPLAERRIVAAPFTIDASLADASGSVPREIAWAALDCPSWFGWYTFAQTRGLGVLGRLHGAILSELRVGEPLVAIGWELGVDGRKIHVGSAVYRASGELVGKARATWILLKPGPARS